MAGDDVDVRARTTRPDAQERTQQRHRGVDVGPEGRLADAL
jgi:hypothetical protein